MSSFKHFLSAVGVVCILITLLLMCGGELQEGAHHKKTAETTIWPVFTFFFGLLLIFIAFKMDKKQ